jgi:kynureninase
LNSGPGGVSGIFVHEKYADRPDLPRFAGWWGYDQESRFLMKKGFVPMKGADGWQLSNVNVLGSVGHIAALTLIEEAGWHNLLEKSRSLTSYLEFLLKEIQQKYPAFTIIMPSEPEERGCQLSLFFPRDGRKVFEYLEHHGVIGDWREDHFTESSERSGVIRIAPVPMYNSFQDVFEFSELLDKSLQSIHE